MFKEILASVGINGAKVDTRLFNTSVVPGDILEGEVSIFGGDAKQDIRDINLLLATEYQQEVEESSFYEECVMVNYRLMERFTISPEEEIVVPFTIDLPYELPLTLVDTPVYIYTDVNIKNRFNARDGQTPTVSDRDLIEVVPHPLMSRVLMALENLDFRLNEVNCEYTQSFGGAYPFIQEFEFIPNGEYRNYLDELEIIFNLNAEGLEVFLEIDKRARGFSSWFQENFDLDERYVRFDLLASDVDVVDVEGMIDDVIQDVLD
ncbi:MAG: sporulation protein [Cyanobacteria bacterium P01_A01_bin.84]